MVHKRHTFGTSLEILVVKVKCMISPCGWSTYALVCQACDAGDVCGMRTARRSPLKPELTFCSPLAVAAWLLYTMNALKPKPDHACFTSFWHDKNPFVALFKLISQCAHQTLIRHPLFRAPAEYFKIMMSPKVHSR